MRRLDQLLRSAHARLHRRRRLLHRRGSPQILRQRNWSGPGTGALRVRFGGDFLSPLVSGETVNAVESLTSPLAGGATFTYTSEYDRPVGGCPPPPPPPPPPTPLALVGAFSKFTKISIAKLLRSGWSTHVTINQPGKIVEDLYQHNGVLPAFAATSKTQAHRTRAQSTAARARHVDRQRGRHGDGHDPSHVRRSTPAQARTQRQSGARHDAYRQVGRQARAGAPFSHPAPLTPRPGRATRTRPTANTAVPRFCRDSLALIRRLAVIAAR